MDDGDVKNALAPLEFILSVAGTLLLVGLLLIVPASIFGSGSFLGFGDSEVCLSAPQSAVGEIEMSGGRNEAHIVGLRRGVSSTAHTYLLCENSPSVSQRAWWRLGNVPQTLFAFAFVMVAWRLTRTARRRGLFSPHLALAVGRLGWFVLLGALAVSLLRSLGDWGLITTMVTAPNDTLDVLVSFFQLSWATLFAGFGLLTVGRVMARTVPMQREIDATV